MIEAEAVVAAGTLKTTCSRDDLLRGLGVVARGLSTRTTVQILAGILLDARDGKLSLAATDMELSLRTTVEANVESEGSVVVPGRLLLDIARLLPEPEVSLEHRLEEAIVEVRCGSASYRLHTHNAEDFPRLPDTQVDLHQVVFGSGEAWLTTRRIDGQFPNYKQLVPEAFEYEVMLPREELLDVVRRVSVMAQRNSPLRLRFAEGELTVSAQTQDVGEARESLPVEFSDEPLEIGFNAEFLRDGIESVAGEQLRMKLISPLRPAVMQGESDDFLYLIMPIRLAG